jgi:hypothetical protein
MAALLCSKGEDSVSRVEGTCMKKLFWVISFLCCAAVQGADIVWTNIAGGTWGTAANWSPNQTPTINDTAWVTNNGTYSVTVNANAAATNLILGGTSGAQTLNHTTGTLSLGAGGSSSANGTYTLNGSGILTGSGTLTLGGPLNWVAGTVGSATSNLLVAANGGLNISGAVAKSFAGGMLINGGAATWTGAQVGMSATAILSNAPSGIFDLQGDGSTVSLNGGTPLVVNSGTFRKTSGTGVSTVGVPFNNGGLVDIQTGALLLNAGGTNTGQFTCSSSAAGLRFNGVNYTLLDGSSISGPGSVSVLGGTVNLQGTVAIGAWTNSSAMNFNTLTTAYITNLTVTANTLNASNTIAVPGMFAWTGGIIGSAGSVLRLLADGGITLNGASKTFNGGIIVNNGTAVWTAGQIVANNTAIFSNAPTAIFDLQADGSAAGLNSGSPLFVNSGTLRKSAGTGTSAISMGCNNSGLVQVQTGTLSFTAFGTSSGQFTTVSGSVLAFSGGTHLLQSGSLVSGAGALSVVSGTLNVQGALNINSLTNGGTLNFNQLATVYPTNVTLNSGTLAGGNTVAVGGSFIWTGGVFGPGSGFTLVANSNLTIGTSGTKTLQGGTLINGGAGAWITGQVTCNGASVFSNAPGATFELQGDGTSLLFNSGTPIFVNAGMFRKSAGTGTNSFTMPCANIGTVEINSGTLALALADGSGTFSVAPGTSLNASGTSTLSPSASITGAGNFAFITGALTNHGTFNIGGNNTFSGGTVRLDGTCTINNAPLIISGGTVLFMGSGSLTPSSLSLSSGALQGTMAMTVSGPFSWTGGLFGSAASTLIVFANGGITLSGATKSFNGGTLVNGGAGAWTAGQVVFNAGLFSNAPAGTLDLQGGGSSLALNSGIPRFGNAGLLRKMGGGTNTVTVPCANFGSVQVNSGVLALTLTDGTGSFAPAAGTTLTVNGIATLSSAASISGAGNFELTSGAITNHGTMNVGGTNSFFNGTARFDGTVVVTNTALAIGGGTIIFSGTGVITPSLLNFSFGFLQGTMPITVLGPMLWTGGTLGTAATVSANGGLTLSGQNKVLSCTLVNNGAATWTNGQLACNSAVFSNSASATLDVLGDGSVFAVNSGTPLLFNDGTLRKTGGAGTASVTIPFSNSGTVQVNTGTLSFSAYTQSGSGQTVMNGGSFSFSQTAQLRGGSLSGNGTITGSVSNNATVSPGASPGVMTITGSYTEGPNSHLQIELGGTTAGVTYDQLSVGGTARLAGTLDVSYFSGFVPSPGNVFTALVCNARSGGFSVINAPTNTLGTVYTARSVLIEPGNASPTAQLAIDQAPIACRTFIIQASGTDPESSVTNLLVLQDTNVLASVSGASAQVTYSSDFPGDVTFTAIATDDKGASGATNVTVNISTLPLLTLDAVGFQTNRSFKLCMTGEVGTNYEVQANTNLAGTNWTVLGTMQNTNGIWRFSDVSATNSTFRAYRARQLP